MADVATHVWTGASGKKYTYGVYKLPITFTECDGNYIFTKLNEQNQHVPIYFGEGALRDRCSDKHHKIACITVKGATHVHCHQNSDEQNRCDEEQDLLAAHPEAYIRTGCNEKEGG